MVMMMAMVFNATFNNISVISWRSVSLVEETRVPGENHRPVASHWQTLSHNVVSSSPRLNGIRTHVSGDKQLFHRYLWIKLPYGHDGPHIQKYRLLSNMAPHGRELITGEKDTIAKTSEEGFSSFKIQEMIGINCRIIQNIFKTDEEKNQKVGDDWVLIPQPGSLWRYSQI